MDSTDCLKRHHSIRAALSGMPDDSLEVCAEYVLTSATTVFRVQANKSAPLLLPAEEISFRAGKGSLMVRRDDESAEFEMNVICMRLRNSKDGACVDTGDNPRYTATSSSRGH
ncbi:MAG: hypothetical protein ACR2IF_02900 [Terriglobales bacterium]